MARPPLRLGRTGSGAKTPSVPACASSHERLRHPSERSDLLRLEILGSTAASSSTPTWSAGDRLPAARGRDLHVAPERGESPPPWSAQRPDARSSLGRGPRSTQTSSACRRGEDRSCFLRGSSPASRTPPRCPSCSRTRTRAATPMPSTIRTPPGNRRTCFAPLSATRSSASGRDEDLASGAPRPRRPRPGWPTPGRRGSRRAALQEHGPIVSGRGGYPLPVPPVSSLHVRRPARRHRVRVQARRRAHDRGRRQSAGARDLPRARARDRAAGRRPGYSRRLCRTSSASTASG